MSKIATKWIADNAVTEAKINTSAAGNGITGGGGSSLSVQSDSTGGANLATVINVSANGVAVAIDDSSIGENGSNQLEVKDLGVTTGKLAGTSVTAAKLGADVAGDGLTGGNGSDIDVQADSTGGANLATVVNVSSNGVAVKIDNSTIGENGSNQLYVPNAGITETQLNTSVAGTGISGGGGSALSIDIPSLTNETSADNADTIVIYDSTATAHREMTRANFLAGVSGGTFIQENHVITSGETTSGYFTLAQTPTSTVEVCASPIGGPNQVNKQLSPTATPDFDILSSNEFHFNNNGSATGLSGDMTTDDEILIWYTY
jgi:hypothetical protein